MNRLIQSEIWRDGGSLSAVITDGQRAISFWLQTNMWDKPSDKNHLELFVSEGDQPELKETRVGIASQEEVEWTEFLTGVSVEDAGEESQERFSEMLHVLRSRLDHQAESGPRD